MMLARQIGRSAYHLHCARWFIKSIVANDTSIASYEYHLRWSLVAMVRLHR